MLMNLLMFDDNLYYMLSLLLYVIYDWKRFYEKYRICQVYFINCFEMVISTYMIHFEKIYALPVPTCLCLELPQNVYSNPI